MDSIIKNWICTIPECDYSWCSFRSSVGVVYTGVKPAEIISVSEKQFQNCLMLKKYVQFKVICKKNDKLRIFIYNKDKMEDVLDNKHIRKYLVKIGYDKEFNLDKYLEILIKKIKEDNDFPHEIGFFLGYPIKDVLGFMNLINLPHTKTMGWKMYGNTKSSEILYYKVKKAKNEITDYVLKTQILTV